MNSSRGCRSVASRPRIGVNVYRMIERGGEGGGGGGRGPSHTISMSLSVVRNNSHGCRSVARRLLFG